MSATGSAQVIRADSRHLPLADNSVDLVVTSPPYFALRSYQDGCRTCAESSKSHMRGYMERYCPGCGKIGTVQKCPKCDLTTLRTDATKEAIRKRPADPDCPECKGSGTGHYDGQIGDEPTPAAFVASLLEVTRECMRVLKPSGSLFVNLGDKYNAYNGGRGPGTIQDNEPRQSVPRGNGLDVKGVRPKSLIGIPWRYALACIDDLGLILRAEVIWSKPNGLPESVTDRVRRSHEQWFHFTLEPRYFSAVDEIREPNDPANLRHSMRYNEAAKSYGKTNADRGDKGAGLFIGNPLGKLPGSVWTIPTEPLRVPDHLGIDHFAAFPTEWPKRIIQGWSPAGVCVACGEGRQPVTVSERTSNDALRPEYGAGNHGTGGSTLGPRGVVATITGYACACPEPTAPTTPAVVLDPFGGTGTTAMVAKALGRTGISVDMSADYCRLAQWRTNDRDQLAKVLGLTKADPIHPDECSLLDLLDEGQTA